MNKIEEKDALLTISDYGLGISCFTRKRKSKPVRNETAILRSDNHKLKLTLFTLMNEESKIKPHRFCDGEIPVENIEIVIRVTKNPKRVDCKKYVGRNRFDRKSNNAEAQDLRWIPHIEGKEFSNARLIPIKNHGIKLSKLTVENALFYCRSLSDIPTYVFEGEVQKQASGLKISNTRDFGKVGLDIGAIIEADEIEITIFQNNVVLESKIITKTNNTRFFLKIENDCDQNKEVDYDQVSSQGDFDIYYKILGGNGKAFNLGQIKGKDIFPIQSKGDGEGQGNKQFCGRAFVESRNSIDYLFEEETV